ncbi:transcriptional regulator [Leptolyngbya sp. Heron Island J]|uniref:helix-turn-helix transcriptional regulator n=1 Tax=Leptolyngbya sp. Heron Island J TaxID=1385935 RepID=UPI0003B9AF56|nr:helix-turn-helix transcriptional regulator [Leptolyngbya sp. Heron Island J]ESA32768.1 transcriptional regulator [Leptolyngbya sp. Heron Island J]
METKNFRSKIATLRDQKGLTQLELALAIGVTETTIANWEKGRSGLPLVLQLIKLCRILDCTLEDLVEVISPDNLLETTNIGDLSLDELHQIIGTQDRKKRAS